MSADNGIYILKLRDEYRVIEASAIENLWWDHLISRPSVTINSWQIIRYYSGANSFKTAEEVREQAFKILEEYEKEMAPLEYGISIIATLDNTWQEIVNEARRYVIGVIPVLKSWPKPVWETEIKEMEKFIEKTNE